MREQTPQQQSRRRARSGTWRLATTDRLSPLGKTVRPLHPPRPRAAFCLWRPVSRSPGLGIQLTGREDLRFARLDDTRSGNEPLADRRAQATDRIVRSENAANHRGGRETTSRVDECADQACMQESKVLPGLAPPGHSNFYFSRLRTEDLDTAPLIEGCGLANSADLDQWIG